MWGRRSGHTSSLSASQTASTLAEASELSPSSVAVRTASRNVLRMRSATSALAELLLGPASLSDTAGANGERGRATDAKPRSLRVLATSWATENKGKGFALPSVAVSAPSPRSTAAANSRTAAGPSRSSARAAATLARSSSAARASATSRSPQRSVDGLQAELAPSPGSDLAQATAAAASASRTKRDQRAICAPAEVKLSDVKVTADRYG
mmetsp:Transcript_9361/g.36538  ORF Transcript_9361/g.36538 Transcript_9361/m.36538 type:complete len:210 (+) Transcript_9361:494-1123(+)